MKWTKRKTAHLKALREQGKSRQQIADELGISKNAVTGKIYRLMGCGSISGMDERQPSAWEHVPTPRASECEYPIGDVGTPGFHFCLDRATRGSYCEKHAKRCYRRWTRGDEEAA